MPGSFSAGCSTKYLALNENNMSHSQQMTQKGHGNEVPQMNHYPSSYKMKGSQEAISGENLEPFGRITMNFSGCTFPDHMAGVPFASGEAASLDSLDCRPSPVLSRGLSSREGSPSAPRGTVLDKAQPLSPS